MPLHANPFASRCTVPARRRPRIGARIERLTLAAIALLVMAYGEQWLFQRAPAAADELTVATCAIDAVDGADARTNACASDLPIHDEATR
jgi:hypothetical protein